MERDNNSDVWGDDEENYLAHHYNLINNKYQKGFSKIQAPVNIQFNVKEEIEFDHFYRQRSSSFENESPLLKTQTLGGA